MSDAPKTPEADKGGQGGEGKKPTEAKATEIDLSNLTPDQLAKVLENKSLWDNPRIKELRDAQKELSTLKKNQEAEDEKLLTEQKKFEELANKKAKENDDLRKELEQSKVDRALTTKLVGEKVVDLDAALKLVDRSKITIDDNGDIQGVDTALETFKTDKAYLFGTADPQNPVGGPTNPGNGNGEGTPGGGTPMFKRSQLTQAFIKENSEAIDKAYAAGQIENDGPPPQS